MSAIKIILIMLKEPTENMSRRDLLCRFLRELDYDSNLFENLGNLENTIFGLDSY